MEILGAFLVMCGITFTTDTTERYNANRINRELSQMDRRAEKRFNRMMKTSERLYRKGE